MTKRKYQVLTDLFFAVAVVSALLFGRLGRYGWVAGVIGIAAGIASAVTYFWNANLLTDSCSAAHRKAAKEDLAIYPAAPQEPDAPTSSLDQLIAEWYGHGVQKAVEAIGIQNSNKLTAGYNLHSREFEQVAWINMHSLRKSEYRIQVEEVAQLIEKITPTCEVELASDGHITIRRIRASEEAVPLSPYAKAPASKWVQ